MTQTLTTVGWREWLSLPELGINNIKAKVDTGAKTCALHAFYIDRFRRDQQDWVRFGIHPLQKRHDVVKHCEARLVDRRDVADSGGHHELRFVIATRLHIGERQFDTEITLTNRETMQFRMLLGRNALKGRFVVDTSQSYCLGKPAVEVTSP